MEHPFVTDLSSKSLEELQETLTSLYGKMNFAQRTQNATLVRQLYMVIESYKSEYNKKMEEMINKQNIKTQVNIQKK